MATRVPCPVWCGVEFAFLFSDTIFSCLFAANFKATKTSTLGTRPNYHAFRSTIRKRMTDYENRSIGFDGGRGGQEGPDGIYPDNIRVTGLNDSASSALMQVMDGTRKRPNFIAFSLRHMVAFIKTNGFVV